MSRAALEGAAIGIVLGGLLFMAGLAFLIGRDVYRAWHRPALSLTTEEVTLQPCPEDHWVILKQDGQGDRSVSCEPAPAPTGWRYTDGPAWATFQIPNAVTLGTLRGAGGEGPPR